MVDPIIVVGGVLASFFGAGVYGLTMRDLIRRGRLHRRNEELLSRGDARALPEGRVVECSECAEPISPAARECPFCRSTV